MYAFLPKQASGRHVSGKNLSELMLYKSAPYRELSRRVKISQVLHSKSESTYGIEQIKLTLGLVAVKSLHSVFEECFHYFSFHAWILGIF